MPKNFEPGECVRIPDGRIGRVREKLEGGYRVRVRSQSGATQQLRVFSPAELQRVACPAGWMSVQGYNRYLAVTLSKMKQRLAQGKRSAAASHRRTAEH